jgi:hypothetical protein
MNLKDWQISDEHFQTMTDRLAKNQIGEIPLSAEQINKILTSCLV